MSNTIYVKICTSSIKLEICKFTCTTDDELAYDGDLADGLKAVDRLCGDFVSSTLCVDQCFITVLIQPVLMDHCRGHNYQVVYRKQILQKILENDDLENEDPSKMHELDPQKPRLSKNTKQKKQNKNPTG